MARYKTRSPQDALLKKIGKISIKRRPRHPDNALFAISYIHRIEHAGEFRFFPVRQVYDTIEILHAQRKDELPLGEQLPNAIHGHILKTLVKAGYLEFNESKTQIEVTAVGSAFMRVIAEKVDHTIYDSAVSKHRAHCDYFRQQVGPLAKLTNKELADENEELQEKVEEYEKHRRTCPVFATPQTYERALSVATEASSVAFDDLQQLHTPDNSMDASQDAEEQDADADADMLPPPEPSSSRHLITPAQIRRPIHSTPANPYMTPSSIPRMRPQRTITQATLTPPPSPFGNRRSLTPPQNTFENDAAGDSMIVDDFPDSETTLLPSLMYNDNQGEELQTLRDENKSLKTWTQQIAELVKPYWGEKEFSSEDTNEISTTTTQIISKLQTAAANLTEKENRVQSLEAELERTQAALNKQIDSLKDEVREVEQELRDYKQENQPDPKKLQDLEEELSTTKSLLKDTIQEKNEAVAHIRSMFMGTEKFLSEISSKEQPTSISAGPILGGS